MTMIIVLCALALCKTGISAPLIVSNLAEPPHLHILTMAMSYVQVSTIFRLSWSFFIPSLWDRCGVPSLFSIYSPYARWTICSPGHTVMGYAYCILNNLIPSVIRVYGMSKGWRLLHLSVREQVSTESANWGFCLPAAIQVYLFLNMLALWTDFVFKCDIVLNQKC